MKIKKCTDNPMPQKYFQEWTCQKFAKMCKLQNINQTKNCMQLLHQLECKLDSLQSDQVCYPFTVRSLLFLKGYYRVVLQFKTSKLFRNYLIIAQCQNFPSICPEKELDHSFSFLTRLCSKRWLIFWNSVSMLEGRKLAEAVPPCFRDVSPHSQHKTTSSSIFAQSVVLQLPELDLHKKQKQEERSEKKCLTNTAPSSYSLAPCLFIYPLQIFLHHLLFSHNNSCIRLVKRA